MRQGSPSGERGHGAKRSPAVTLDASDWPRDQNEIGRTARGGLSAHYVCESAVGLTLTRWLSSSLVSLPGQRGVLSIVWVTKSHVPRARARRSMEVQRPFRRATSGRSDR